jgi:hypothetical protein
MRRLQTISRKPSTDSGSVLVTILVLMMFSTSLLLGLDILANANLFRARSRIFVLQAQYTAESGADAAIATLNSGNTTYTGTISDVQVLSTSRYKATYATTVSTGSSDKQRIIIATGKVYAPATASTPTYTRKIRVIADRSSTQTASAILSRNIIEVGSGVKNIYARDIYANGYINLNKNTTNLVAENITVAGKNTGASNCSIGGSGNLVKPTSFSTAGQTKTNLTLAYNNCITPPGNASNANFNVSVNNTNVSTIQSTFIPWGQYMDNSYQNSPSGCNDWTTGSSPRTIPTTGNTKKTHYPDSSSNVSTSCGTSGNVDLGSNTYILQDNVHIRANLCGTSGCNPTFTNPSASVVYVFVEGTINFTSVTTTAGSGPIVFITYGADPSSLTGVCPYGGSIYIGQSGSGSTSAPAAFFLAQNGLCIDGTKFSSDPALGGIGGKNLYVASNPSTPRDLHLDPTFPVSSIPIDLSWRESGYERL